MSNFRTELSAHEKENSMGSDFYKFKSGDNKLRIMTEPIKKVSRWGHGICYEGAVYCLPETLDKEFEEKKAKAKTEGKDVSKISRSNLSTKWSVWAIDRKNGSFVILDLPTSIAKELSQLMDGDEYGFTEWPMPYDINIIASGQIGTKDVEYKLQGSRKNTPITEEEFADFAKVTPIDQILERMKTKKKEQDEGKNVEPGAKIEYPEEDINPENIPF